MEEDSLASGRAVDIELGGQEVITIDLDNLDSNPEDVLDLLREGIQCKVWVWTKLAAEYWRRGFLDAAEKIALSAVESFKSNQNESALSPMYSLLANLQISYARTAPKLVLPDPHQDDMTNAKPKEEYYRDAAQLLNKGDRVGAESGEGMGTTLSFLTRGIQQLATRSMDDALRSFEGVLAEKPTNLVALLGKARILYARRNYREALKLFQDVLRYSPQCIPDPRIGIGLCFWALDQKARAKAAWQRSLEVNPSQWSAQLLLGLESINTSKTDNLTESERTHALIGGTKLIEKAFNANQKSAAAANALCEIFLRKGNFKRGLKLAERTIQFADTLTILTEGYLRAGRICHAEGSLPHATKFFSLATEGQPKHILGAIGMAQMQMLNDEMAAAIHTLDTLLEPPNPQRSSEATVMLASLRAFQRPGISSSDLAKEKAKAKELFERVMKTLESDGAKANSQNHLRVPRTIVDDMEMHVEIAHLWHNDSLDRMGKALGEALRISTASDKVDPRLVNNLAALQQLEGNLTEARAMYENALTSAAALSSNLGEGFSASILYNLARVYEDQGETTAAEDAYVKLLSRHPEYVDAKVRQAQMLSNLSRFNEAHELLKQCLVSQPSNLNVRAFYTHFLIQSNLPKLAKDFVFATLRDYDNHDVYSLCASGWIMYHQSRESRDNSQKGLEERRRGFQRSAEFYEKALQLDPTCAFAAQGLAISTAEDAVGTFGGVFPGASGVDEGFKRLNNARDALDIFAKVRESINDGSVYINTGHCYYVRDDFDRAIESYSTASTRFYDGHNVPVLLYLCRSWYSKAIKDQSFSAINTAIRYAQSALHIQPHDKAVLYNIAMIQQKSAEMMFSLPPPKRTLKELQRVVDQATHAQKLFATMASDKSPIVPYSRDVADQRRKYGDIMLRKRDEHLTAQRLFETESKAKLETARRIRQEEHARQLALEEAKRLALREEAEKIAEVRRQAREQALVWSNEVKMESDEERERKRKPRKPKAEASGDEAEPKKKRRGKLRKVASDHGDDEGAPVFSEEEVDRPAAKRPGKKRVVRDEDEDDEASSSRKKQFKSKAMLSDTDDEMS